MPVFGVVTQHTTPADGERKNRWWLLASSLDDAVSLGNDIVDEIRQGFGAGCTFNNIHAWVPNVTPNQFLNFPIAKPGLWGAGAPTSAVPCIKLEFAAGANSYVNYKAFRVCVNPNEQSGRNWGGPFSEAWGDILAILATRDYIVGKNGAAAFGWAFTNEVYYRQLSKRWYNRGSSDND